MKTYNKKIKINFEKIKDFFIVNFIRFKNLVMEHKYISSVTFLFLVSCIVAIVVFAEGDDYAGKITTELKNIALNKPQELQGDYNVFSFDTTTFSLEYVLKTQDGKTVDRDVEINAKICSNDVDTNDVNAWDKCEKSSLDVNFEYGIVDDNVSYTVDEEEKTLNVLVYGVSSGTSNTHFQNVYLKVNNVKDAQKIYTIFQVKETTEESSKGISKYAVKVKSEEQVLSSKVVSGNAHKVKGFNGRYMPFGILLGFEGDTLKGKYFNPSQTIKLSATSDGSSAELSTKKEDYGFYEKKSKLIDNIPNGIYDDNYLNNFVYDSGKVSLDKSEEGNNVTQSIDEVKSKALYLLGNKTVVKTKDSTYDDPGVSLSSNGKKISLDDNNITIYKDDKIVENIHNINDIKEIGNYKIKYTYKESSFEISIYRNVVIETKDTIELEGKKYTLNGNKNIYLKKNSQYIESGILKDGSALDFENDSDVTVETSRSSEDIFSKGGTITYTIISRTDSSNQKILKRTINIIEDEEIKSVNEYTLNEELVSNCKTNDKCSIEYYNDETKIEDISSISSGKYDILYKLSNEDFDVLIKSKITISKESYYELKIEDIKTDDIYYKDNNFSVLGSYYVNVKSIRQDGEEKDITVSLTSTVNNISLNSATCINPKESLGTKDLLLEFYDDSEQKLDSKSLVAYEDDVILKTKFNYSIDGDYSLDKFKVKIPINNNYYTLLSYSSEIENENIYYETNIDKESITVEYYTSNGEKIDTDSDKKNAAYMVYELEKVNPGDEINFAIRLKLVNKSENKSEVSLEDVECSYKENNEPKSFKASTNKLFVKAFRSHATVTIDESDETVVNESKLSTIVIYPEVIMPSTILYASNALNLDKVIVTVTLPDKVNYINNESYIKPISNEGKTLKYEYSGKKANDWFDPIYIDINYDINTANESSLSVKTELEATSGNISSIYKTTNNIIFYGENSIRTTLSSQDKIISKNTGFKVNFNTYNAEENEKDVGAVIVFPYNSDVESDKLFNGIYEITLPENVLCTTESSSKIVSNSDNIISENIWKDCTEYNSNEITAIKIEDKNNISKEFTIIPKDNEPEDKYIFESYVYVKDQDNKYKIINERTATVSVVSRMITGTVWEDFNENGIMDEEEEKISGVVLKLYDRKGSYVRQAISNEKGQYSLGIIKTDKYYVVPEFDREKYALTSSNASNNKSDNSVFAFSDETYEITTSVEFSKDTKIIDNVNLGLTLRRYYNVKVSKYISKVISTNRLGISTIRDFGNVTLAKVDVKDLTNMKIKVIYTIELENVGYYPGYIYKVIDYLPDGMTFNKDYAENKGWSLNEEGYVENTTLENKLMYSNDKQYLTVAFDISRKEAGSFINIASVDEDDLKVYVTGDEENGGEDEDVQEDE